MKIEDFRRYLHRNPSLAGKEQSVAEFIAGQLSELGVEFCYLSDNSILARVEGKRGNLKRCVVLCADISAMPLAELTGVEWASQQEGVMHSLGNDLNAAVVYGTLKRLQAERDFEGTLLVLFQSGEAEEVGGAKSVLAQDPFKEYNIAAIIGEQLSDGLEVGEIGFCPGKFTPSTDRLQITVCNENQPSAVRNKVADSVVAISDLIMRLYTFNSDVCSLSVGSLSYDVNSDVLSPKSRCEARMVTYDEKLRSRVKEMIAHMAEEIEYKYDVEVDVKIEYGSPCVENNAQLTYEAMLLADSSGFTVKDVERCGIAHDFGYYSQLYPSMLYTLGVGRSSGRLCSASFLPDERALEVGEEFMYQLALNILNK